MLHQGLPRARDHDSRYLHPGPAGGDKGDDRGNDSFRHRYQSAYDPGFAGGALPRHLPLPPGIGKRLARWRQQRARRHPWRADRPAPLSASEPYRNLRFGGNVLQAFLFPQRQDRGYRRRDGQEPGDDETPAARGHRVLSLPARAQGKRALKALIVTADDFGIAPEVNAAVELAHTRGILTAASLMVNGAAVDDAVERARRLPSLRVGLHLVLVDGPSVLPPERIPDLVDAQARLRTDLAMTGVAIFLRPRVRRQLAAEIEAQFRAYRATGLPLDHVNAHHHFHLHPTVCAQMLDIGMRYGLNAVRVPREPLDMLARIESRARYRRKWLAGPWTALLPRRGRRRGMTTPDHVFGPARSGAMTAGRS